LNPAKNRKQRDDNQDHHRVEDDRLIRGAGCFVADLATSETRHVLFVRSPVAHGRLVGLDVAAAASHPGVELVLTGADMATLAPLPVNRFFDHQVVAPTPYLATDKLYAVGQPVAAIVARSRRIAEDAADLVQLDFDTLPAVSDVVAAQKAPAIYAGMADNLALDHSWRQGDCDRAFDAAAHVVEISLTDPKVAPSTLEPRACLMAFDANSGCLSAAIATQTPHRAKACLADVLALDRHQVEVIAPDVGGAFGMKAALYPEDIITAFAAKRLGAAVLWQASRSEDLIAGSHGRGSVISAKLALSADGRMTALHADIQFPLGYFMPFSAAVPAWNAGRILPGPYQVAAVDIRARGYITTTAPMGIYRGAGRPEAAMIMESLVDAAAAKLNADPFEFRQTNLIAARDMPFRTATGMTLDSGDYATLLTNAAELAGLSAPKLEQTRRRAAGELIGIGMGFYVEPSGIGWESAQVSLMQDGSIVAATGSTGQGQGRETAAAQIVASVIGCHPSFITIRHGHTADLPNGIGALASRSTPIGGSALLEAAAEFTAVVKGRAADLLGVSSDKIDLDGTGAFIEADAGQAKSWAQLAASVSSGADGRAICASSRYETQGEAWGYGCTIAVVSIDRQTGALTVERIIGVDDAGRLINPQLAEDQVVGGIAQGLGATLMEQVIYDDDGQLLTGSLMDYALPRADQIPPINLSAMQTPSPMNLIGAKGIGEAGAIGTPPAIYNAVIDALRPLGVNQLDLPLTSAKIWQALNEAANKDEAL